MKAGKLSLPLFVRLCSLQLPILPSFSRLHAVEGCVTTISEIMRLRPAVHECILSNEKEETLAGGNDLWAGISF